MPICDKDPDPKERYSRERTVETEYLEETFNVIVREEADGGFSHSYERHGWIVKRTYLEGRLVAQTRLTCASKFVSERLHQACRAKWLAAFAPEMNAIKNPKDGRQFQRSLDMGEQVGMGVTRQGDVWAISHATFGFEYNKSVGKWVEITGYPELAPKNVHGRWGN